MVSSSFRQMWNSAYTKLFIIEICLQMGMQTVQPITSNTALAFGATVTLAGILAGTNSAVALVLRLVCGRIVSRMPLKKTLLASTAIFFVTSISVALFGNIVVLGASRILYGVAIVFKSVLAVALAVRVVPKESLGQAVAWLGMVNIFAIAVGPQIAQFLGLNFGYSMTFAFSATMFVVAFFVSMTFPDLPVLESEDEAEKADGDAAKAPKRKSFVGLLNSFFYVGAVPIMIMGIFEATMFGIVNTLTLTVGELRGLPETSFFFVSYVIVSFASRPILGKWYDKYGFLKVCLPMCILMMLSMISFAFTNSLPMVILDGVLFALGQGCLWPCLQAESVKDVPLEKSSLAANTFLLGVDVGIAAGPMVGGAILDAAGPMGLYGFGTVVGLCLVIWVFPYSRIVKKRSENNQ